MNPNINRFPKILITLMVLCAAIVLASEQSTVIADTLRGTLPASIAGDRVYIVKSDIEVAPGKTVVIEPGAVLLFGNFLSLHVQGILYVKGTALKPVVFTSENDQKYNPSSTLLANPYDWTGLYIHADAVGTILENIIVTYSVYGINSETKFIKITDARCHFNGRANLSIEREAIEIREQPFSYSLSIKDLEREGVPLSILNDPFASRRSVFRYGGITLFFTGLGVGIWQYLLWQNAVTERTDFGADLTLMNKVPWDAANKRAERARSLFAGGVGGLVAGGISLCWSFTF
jgi:hypothetical protein